MATPAAEPRITVAQYYQMAADGTLHEDDRVELIEGELHWMTPIGSAHAASVNYLAAIFNQQLAQRAVVVIQNPVHLDEHSEPQPDLSLARWRPDYYHHAHPTPADLLLLVEVADSTLHEDRHLKAPLYARHGIPEFWIVNLPQDLVEVYTRPRDGRYHSRVLQHRAAQIGSAAFSDLQIRVADILG